jgi:hypothetical protein
MEPRYNILYKVDHIKQCIDTLQRIQSLITPKSKFVKLLCLLYDIDLDILKLFRIIPYVSYQLVAHTPDVRGMNL